VRRLPVIGWYTWLIKRAAQPRDADALERQGIAKDLYGSRRAREGWAATQWALESAILSVCAVAAALAGLWWFGLLVSPLAAYAAARMIGTARERYYY
jgi:hypothetical protein